MSDYGNKETNLLEHVTKKLCIRHQFIKPLNDKNGKFKLNFFCLAIQSTKNPAFFLRDEHFINQREIVTKESLKE